MGRLRRRPSPALVVACLALAVALGGTGYAAIVLPANSVGTKQLKNGAVVATKVKMHSLVAENFKDGQLPSGPRNAPNFTESRALSRRSCNARPMSSSLWPTP